MNSNAKTLSIVIPCHNEEELIENTYKTLQKLIDGWLNDALISDYEIVMVNNGSTDNTIKKMEELFSRDNKIVIIDLRKNFGYQGSITAGLFNASNDMIVSIDADLQDEPEKIEDMIKEYYKGFELVLGIRSDRSADGFLKRATAQTFYKLIESFGVKSVYNHGDFRLMSKELVNELKKMPERNRYLRSMIFEIESKYSCVYYKRREREKGETKFRPANLIALAVDAITSFSSFPIRLVFFIGLFLFGISILGMIFVAYMKFIVGVPVSGWASMSVFILFFSGLQNLSIGLIGEYISKIYIETKERPIFSIRKIIEREKN